MANAYDFTLAFARLPAKPTVQQLEEARATGQLTVEAEAVVLLPPSVIPGLIRALSLQKNKFEAQWGTISDPGATE